jgi:hypothetical protein
LRTAVRRWLEAEGRGDGEAERALTAVLRRLPAEPPAGFAERVLARSGLVPARERRGLLAGNAARLATGAALLLAGCAAILLPPVAAVLLPLVSPAALVEGMVTLVSEAGQGLARALSLVDLFASLGRVAGGLAATPAVAATLLLAALLAAAALRVLEQLMTSERSARYADSN